MQNTSEALTTSPIPEISSKPINPVARALEVTTNALAIPARRSFGAVLYLPARAGFILEEIKKQEGADPSRLTQLYDAYTNWHGNFCRSANPDGSMDVTGNIWALTIAQMGNRLARLNSISDPRLLNYYAGLFLGTPAEENPAPGEPTGWRRSLFTPIQLEREIERLELTLPINPNNIRRFRTHLEDPDVTWKAVPALATARHLILMMIGEVYVQQTQTLAGKIGDELGGTFRVYSQTLQELAAVTEGPFADSKRGHVAVGLDRIGGKSFSIWRLNLTPNPITARVKNRIGAQTPPSLQETIVNIDAEITAITGQLNLSTTGSFEKAQLVKTLGELRRKRIKLDTLLKNARGEEAGVIGKVGVTQRLAEDFEGVGDDRRQVTSAIQEGTADSDAELLNVYRAVTATVNEVAARLDSEQEGEVEAILKDTTEVLDGIAVNSARLLGRPVPTLLPPQINDTPEPAAPQFGQQVPLEAVDPDDDGLDIDNSEEEGPEKFRDGWDTFNR